MASLLLAVAALLVAVVWSGSRLPDPSLLRWASIAQLFQAVIGLLTLIPILWAVARYRRIADDERKVKHYQAWQAISNAQGKPGSGGRKTALEELHRDRESLDGVNLTGGAHLVGLRLPGADLAGARLQEADLRGASLQGANLGGTDLQEANLREAELQRAALWGTNLMKADLGGANLQEANLGEANLQEANLWGTNFLKADLWGTSFLKANLRGANLQEANLWEAYLQEANMSGASLLKASLRRANLQEANLQGANLAKANLGEANLKEADLGEANISSAINLTRDQVLSTRDWRGAALPENIKDLELPIDASDHDLERVRKATPPEDG